MMKWMDCWPIPPTLVLLLLQPLAIAQPGVNGRKGSAPVAPSMQASGKSRLVKPSSAKTFPAVKNRAKSLAGTNMAIATNSQPPSSALTIYEHLGYGNICERVQHTQDAISSAEVNDVIRFAGEVMINEKVELNFTEITELRTRDQRSSDYMLTQNEVSGFSRTKTRTGDRVETKVNSAVLNPAVQLAESNVPNPLVSGSGAGGVNAGVVRSTGGSVIVTTPTGSTVAAAAGEPTLAQVRTLPNTEKSSLVREFLTETAPGQYPDSVVSSFILDDTFVLRAAKHRWSRFPATRNLPGTGLRLSTDGDERYFEFIPEGDNQFHPARVLNLHHKDGDRWTSAFVEIVDSVPTTGQRRRRLMDVKKGELSSFRRGDPQSVRRKFRETLTPIELATIDYATDLGLDLFSYSAVDTMYWSAYDFNFDSTLDRTYRAVIEARFGSIQWLFDEAKRAGNQTESVIELFAMLPSGFVMQKFRARDFEYMWVITEDGKLKVCPKFGTEYRSRSQIGTLAGIRKIYAAGTFTLDTQNRVHLKYEPNAYQSLNQQSVDTELFTANQPKLDLLVRSTLNIQGKLNAFRSSLRNPGLALGNGGPASYLGQNDVGADSEEREFHEEFLNRFGRSWKDAQKKQAAWDPDSDTIPERYSEWRTERYGAPETYRQIDQKARKQYAYYALGVTEHTQLADIKTIFRKLSMRFRTDRNPGDQKAKETFQALAEAYHFAMDKGDID